MERSNDMDNSKGEVSPAMSWANAMKDGIDRVRVYQS